MVTRLAVARRCAATLRAMGKLLRETNLHSPDRDINETDWNVPRTARRFPPAGNEIGGSEEVDRYYPGMHERSRCARGSNAEA